MAKKKRKAGSRKKSQPLPPIVWLLAGLSIGLAVAFAIYVNDRQTMEPVAAIRQEPTIDREEIEAETPPTPERRFDFYEMLPKFEVVIPEEDLDVVPDVKPQPLELEGVYVLQAGSFSAYNDADRMKARLALLGIPSTIQRITVDDNEYHRVRIGPIDNLSELNRTRAQLREAQVEILVIRIAD